MKYNLLIDLHINKFLLITNVIFFRGGNPISYSLGVSRLKSGSALRGLRQIQPSQSAHTSKRN